MSCRTARREDLPRLVELWHLCFGDEEGFIRRFFQWPAVLEGALVLEADGQVVSMLLTFPREVEGQPACYGYAFCTHPACQDRGYGRRLLAWAEDRAREQGRIALILVPGEESLYQFYRSLGYTETLLRRERRWKGPRPERSASPLRPLSPEDYLKERSHWLQGVCSVGAGEEILAQQRRLSQATGGDLYQLPQGGVAAAELWDGKGVVKELLCPDWTQGAAILAAGLGVEELTIALPPVPGKENAPFGVMKWLGQRPASWTVGYFAFAFD